MGATHRRKRPRATPLEDAAAPETGTPDAADASDVPDASDAASPGTLHTFDYFHDGASIRWVGPHGNGTVQSLPGPAPEHFSFPEGKLTGDGHVTERRASAIIKIADNFYRLDGRATTNGDDPPPPAQLATFTTSDPVCFAWVVSDLADRSKSRLIFQHEPVCSTVGPREDRPTHSIRLGAGANDTADQLPLGIYPLIGDEGDLEDVLRVTGNALNRVTSLTNATVLADLSDSKSVLSVSPVRLGGGLHLLPITRANGNSELYVYDANTHTIGTSLGEFSNFAYFGRTLPRDGTYAYFVGTKIGLTDARLFRLKTQLSSTVEPLAGLSASGGANISVLDVVAGRILYRTTGTLGNAVYSLPTSADFAAPPTPVTLLSGNLLYPILWSTTRFFYQEGSIANVMRLDGTGSEMYEGVDLSYWIGCTGGRSADIPAHPENSERCRRVYLADTNAGTGGAVHSYDAEADPAGAFFASTSRAHVAHGALPDEYFMAAMIVDTERVTTVHSTSPYDVVAAKLEMKPTIGDAFRTALFSIVDTGAGGGPLSMFAQPTSSVVWLSRDP